LNEQETCVRLLKLSCASCLAPLEIGEDLERFTCSYCGAAQIIERSGGAIATRKIETVLQAVQRGTDRTAAELAMPRLTRELAEAQSARADILATARKSGDRAMRARRKAALITFCVVLFLGPLAAGMAGSMGGFFSLIWSVAIIAVPIWVYKNFQLPADKGLDATAAIDARISHLEEHLRVNRSILNTLPA
jgi:predicted RNA-binding Zn-ribbon protein involved in translation (DUF1610 family)